MKNSTTVKTERLDDIPLILSQLEKMGISSLLNNHFPTHGNWGGMSLGDVACVWLTHILSEADHCLDHVRSWSSQRIISLQGLVNPQISEYDFTDDHLALLLTYLSDEDAWASFEKELNQHLLHVYDLNNLCIRHDSTTSSSFRSLLKDEGSLFQFGPSKDHRPDLPQLKIMLATLDPLGMPLATEVLPGHYADDPLYIPSIRRVQESLKKKGLLHVGDCKLSSLANRAFIVHSGDAYLCPLSKKQLSEDQLQEYLQSAFQSEEAMREIYRLNAKGKEELIAKGFEREQVLSSEINGIDFCWKERHLVVRSFQHAQAAERGLNKRLEKAQAQLESLNQRGRGKSRPKDRATLEKNIEKIINQFKVDPFLEVLIKETHRKQPIRRHKDRPATIRIHWNFQIQVSIKQEKLDQHIQRLGWRVYATILPKEQFSLEEAILCYRNEFRIEHNFKRIKGPLSLRPMYLTREDRMTGLIHLLTIALRALSLIEFNVRQMLEKSQETLPGLYPENPKRATSSPTTEKLLQAFKEIYLTVVTQKERTTFFINDLSDLQLYILELLNLQQSVYYQLRNHFLEPT